MSLEENLAGTWRMAIHTSEAMDIIAAHLARVAAGLEVDRPNRQERAPEQKVQSDLLRDIFGNPFRPVAFDPTWRSANVVGIAQGIYDERAFERLPILADALEDAGCANADVLNHCRQPGEHVRGCWVIDLVLGKS